MSTGAIVALVAMLQVLAVPTAAALDIPGSYPELDDATATAYLVIATLAPGEEFPENDEPCGGTPKAGPPGEGPAELDSICIRFRTPFWMRADIRWSLVGDVPPVPLIVSSASHYETPDHDGLAGVNWLLPLITDGTSYVTYDRQRAVLYESRSGELYLMLWDEHPPEWLPCSIEELREPVSASDFVEPIGWPRESMAGKTPESAPQLRFGDTMVEPRYAISMSRLRAHLAGHPIVPGADALDCARE